MINKANKKYFSFLFAIKFIKIDKLIGLEYF